MNLKLSRPAWPDMERCLVFRASVRKKVESSWRGIGKRVTERARTDGKMPPKVVLFDSTV